MIAQYLKDEGLVPVVQQHLSLPAGYSASMLVLQDEAQLRFQQAQKEQAKVRRMKQAILDGLWDEVFSLCKQVRELVSGHPPPPSSAGVAICGLNKHIGATTFKGWLSCHFVECILRIPACSPQTNLSRTTGPPRVPTSMPHALCAYL